MKRSLKVKLILAICAAVLVVSCNSEQKIQYFKGQSPNMKNGRFYNSFEEQSSTAAQKRPNGWKFLKWLLFKEGRVKWTAKDAEQFASFAPYQKKERAEGAEVVFINHSSFLIQIEGVNMITDPIWSKRASPISFMGPKRLVPPPFKMEDLPKIDYVLVSHSHYDHMDIPTLKKLDEMFSPTIISGLGACAYLKTKGLENCIEKDWGETAVKKDGVEIIFEKAKHWSKRSLYDANKILWGSFVVKSPRFQMYFAGDTGYGRHFKMIGEAYGSFDLALLPIGGYEPRSIMESSHTNPEEAVLAHLELKAKKSVGMHLKTFQLTDEAYNAPVEDLEKAKLKHGLLKDDFIELKFGERYFWMQNY